MSQLNSLNQTHQAQTNSKVSELKTVNADITKVTVNLGKNLQGRFELQGVRTSITQQLTIAQANLLSQQPLVALMTQQSALIFLQSQNNTATLNLPTVLLTITQQWLKQAKGLQSKIPAELVSFITEKLNISPEKLTSQLISTQLTQSLLQLNFFQGEPVTELKLSTATTQQAAEQLEHLLQFMLPIKAQDDASVFVQQQNSSNTADEEGKLKLKLQFNLEQLGKLEVQVELMEFELSTICICDSPQLQQKVKQYWPQLETRLSALGFNLDNQIKQKNRLEQSEIDRRPSGLINVKV